MARWNVGPKNGNWKGGRTIASNGYVLVRVGTDHHLADIRGYAYEHRIKAEKKIGRRLTPGEIVHHKDGNKQNNKASNLEVLGGIAEHRFQHRKPGCKRREPGQPNRTIKCLCGCGRRLRKYDSSGRPRSYISGHNPMKAPAQDAVIDAIGRESVSVETIAKRSGKSKRVIGTNLSRLKSKGLVCQVSRGIWQHV